MPNLGHNGKGDVKSQKKRAWDRLKADPEKHKAYLEKRREYERNRYAGQNEANLGADAGIGEMTIEQLTEKLKSLQVRRDNAKTPKTLWNIQTLINRVEERLKTSFS
jgi:enoyl reductase-like protein